MKYLIIIAVLLLPISALAARFDFSAGVPAVIDDGEVTDTLEQTRYDYSGGAPTPVFDATASAAALEQNTTVRVNGGVVRLNNGRLVVE